MKTTNIGFALILLLAVSCDRSGSHQPVPARTEASPSPTISASDQAVLDAALADLATYDGKDSPVVCRDAPLNVAPDSIDWSVTVDDVLYRHDPKLWRTFPQSDEAAFAHAAADLVSRTTSLAGFAGFRSENPEIRVAEVKSPPQPQRVFPAARPIRVWPPGYSADGRLAVVRMSIPWSIHHAEATYVLANREGNWLVQVRQFVYYL